MEVHQLCVCGGRRRLLCRSYVSLHTLYYVPSYTLQGVWLLLGVSVSNVQKSQTINTHTHKLYKAVMLYDRAKAKVKALKY